MNFVSWPFVVLFLLAFAARLTIGQRKTERPFFWLTVVLSTVFVMWHVPIYILIMLATITVDYIAALRIAATRDPAQRRLFLYLSMTTNLLVLGVFKYTDFTLQTSQQLLHIAGHHATLPRLSLILPMGISFYTFGSMSYTVDVYRNRLKPIRKFQDFYSFVTFFPHLVAGPIVRAEQFFYQTSRTRHLHFRVFSHAAFLIIRGAFLKMVCADSIATIVSPYWYHPANNSGDQLLVTLLFSAQIFCDFEGYSSIARGLAYLMGFRFPVNFDNPYIATSFSNFWERWHITLSSWLRDYLYIPLGGNRMSASRTYFNLLAVMLLGGLWHGASLTFVVWGAIHGIALAIERKLKLNRLGSAHPVFRLTWYFLVQAVVLFAWIFFRSNGMHDAVYVLGKITALQFGALNPDILRATAFLLPVVGMHLYGVFVERGELPVPGKRYSAVLAAIMTVAVLTLHGKSNEFIYFQF